MAEKKKRNLVDEKGKTKENTFVDEKGYICFENTGKTIHRTAAWQHLYSEKKYPKKFREYQVHHKDLDKKNNDISNLEIVTKEKHKKIHDEHRNNEELQLPNPIPTSNYTSPDYIMPKPWDESDYLDKKERKIEEEQRRNKKSERMIWIITVSIFLLYIFFGSYREMPESEFSTFCKDKCFTKDKSEGRIHETPYKDGRFIQCGCFKQVPGVIVPMQGIDRVAAVYDRENNNTISYSKFNKLRKS
jgi:hypothetical protein